MIAAGQPGGRTDSRLFEVRAAGMQETIPSEGGFLVQHDFASELIGSLFKPGTLLSKIRRYGIGRQANSMSMPGFDETSRANGSRWGGIMSYWGPEEGGQITATKPKIRKIEMALGRLTGLCYLTQELTEDVPELEKYLKDIFRAEFQFRLEDGILNGSGAGQLLGLANSGALVETATASSAGTFYWSDVKAMMARFKPLNPEAACWVANIDCLPSLLSLYQPAGTGGVPVYQASQNTGLGTLCGWPLYFSEAAASVGTKMDLVLFDPSAYLLVEKAGVGIQTAFSMHLRFEYAENALRFIYRCNGQPLFGESITPYKGSDSVSPYVALATR